MSNVVIGSVQGLAGVKINVPRTDSGHDFFLELGGTYVKTVKEHQYVFVDGTYVAMPIDQISAPMVELVWYAPHVKKFDIGVFNTLGSNNIGFSFVDSTTKVLFPDKPAPNLVNDSLNVNRINSRVVSNPDTRACGISHVGIYVQDLEQTTRLYQAMGFHVSDVISGRCVFLRCIARGFHHSLLLVKDGDKEGLHHVSFEMPDFHSLVAKGMKMGETWKTVKGPGRHPISSAFFWYFDTLAGAMELSTDQDYLTEKWMPSVFEPSLSNTIAWVVEGGIDNVTRSQHKDAATSTFINSN